MRSIVGDTSNWSRDALSLKVDSSILTSFWNDIWVRGSHLSLRFPRLFLISDQSSTSMGDAGKIKLQIIFYKANNNQIDYLFISIYFFLKF